MLATDVYRLSEMHIQDSINVDQLSAPHDVFLTYASPEMLRILHLVMQVC